MSMTVQNYTGTSPTDIQLRLLQKLLEEVQAIRERLGSEAGQSSVEVATSTRGVDLRVKCYRGSSIEDLGDTAVSEWLRLRESIERQLMGGFEQEARKRGVS